MSEITKREIPDILNYNTLLWWCEREWDNGTHLVYLEDAEYERIWQIFTGRGSHAKPDKDRFEVGFYVGSLMFSAPATMIFQRLVEPPVAPPEPPVEVAEEPAPQPEPAPEPPREQKPYFLKTYHACTCDSYTLWLPPQGCKCGFVRAMLRRGHDYEE